MAKKQKLSADGEEEEEWIDGDHRETEDEEEEEEWTEEEIAKDRERIRKMAEDYAKVFAGLRDMTDEERAEYGRMVKESEGAVRVGVVKGVVTNIKLSDDLLMYI